MAEYEGMLTEQERDRLFEASGHRSSGPGWSSLMETVESILREHKADAWWEAVNHMWALADPISTVEPVNLMGNEVYVCTMQDMWQTKRENRYSRDDTKDTSPPSNAGVLICDRPTSSEAMRADANREPCGEPSSEGGEALCWCGAERGMREPSDSDGLGCLTDITHRNSRDATGGGNE